MALEHLWYCAYGNHVATAALESLTIHIARFWLTHHRHQGNRWLLITRKKETERRQGSWSLQPTAIACAIPMERLYPSLFRVGSDPFFFPLGITVVLTPPFFLLWKAAVSLHHFFFGQSTTLCQVARTRKLVLPCGTICVIFLWCFCHL